MRMMKKLTPIKVTKAIMKFADANGDKKLDFEEAQKTVRIVFGKLLYVFFVYSTKLVTR